MLLIVLDFVWECCGHSFPAVGHCARYRQAERRASCSFLPIGCQIAPSFRPDREGAEQRLARFRDGDLRSRSSAPVLLVADLLHPVDRLAVEPLLDGDVAHRRGRRRAGRGFRSVISVTPSYGELCFNLTMRWTAGRTAAGLEMRRCCEIYEATACTMSA